MSPPWNEAVNDCEWRTDRGDYAEETASTVVHPNGTLMASFDRPLLGSLTREVLAVHEATTEEAAA